MIEETYIEVSRYYTDDTITFVHINIKNPMNNNSLRKEIIHIITKMYKQYNGLLVFTDYFLSKFDELYSEGWGTDLNVAGKSFTVEEHAYAKLDKLCKQYKITKVTYKYWNR